jgi:hypothetical protein
MVMTIVLLRLPIAFAAKPPTSLRVLVALPLAVGIALLVPRRRSNRVVSLLGVLVCTFAVLIAVAMLRGEKAGAYADSRTVYYEIAVLCLLVGFGYLYFATATSSRERDHRMFVLCCVPGTYVAVQAALYIAGVHHVAAGVGEGSASAGTPAQLLGLLGIHAYRALFPLANGVVNFGDTAGAALAVSGILAIKTTGRQRQIAAFLVVASLYALLETDARAALVAALAAVILAVLLGRRRVIAALAFVVPFTTAIMSVALGLIAQTSLVTTLSRKGDDLVTATDRTVIWHAVLSFLSHPSLTQIYGYGANGQITSGANSGYVYLFWGTANPSVYSAHNFMLQTVLDIGYGGLLVFVMLLYLTARRMQQMIVVSDQAPAMALLGALIYFIINGATDTSPSIYSPETIYLFVLIITCAAAIRLHRRRQTAPAKNIRHSTAVSFDARRPRAYQPT